MTGLRRSISSKRAEDTDGPSAVSDPRYACQPDTAHFGRWTVTDTLTGLPAASDGRDFIDLGKSDAADIAEALNSYLSEGKDPPLV